MKKVEMRNIGVSGSKEACLVASSGLTEGLGYQKLMGTQGGSKFLPYEFEELIL